MSTQPAPHEPQPDLVRLLDLQRAAQLAQGEPPARVRIDRIDRCIDLLVAHRNELCEAVACDFGQRPAAITRSMDILPSVLALKHARRNLRRWMRPERRGLQFPLRLPGTRARIMYQPLGVVGIISPWNFPIGLCFDPLASVLAAGNRCLIKPSELTPQTSALMQRLVAASFDAAEVAVVTGGRDVGERFAALPFDHLLFTGSPAVGRRVMAAAAERLVPVTLELGGKCPVVVGRSADLTAVVDRVLTGKLANAGQVCLAPDHVYLPREWLEDFVGRARAWVARAYPGLPDNGDYTSIVNARHYERLEALVADAINKGAHVVPVAGAGDSCSRQRRLFAPQLVLNASDDMRIMREEIFGPLLPVLAYDRLDEAIAGINTRPRPLALYYFGKDIREQRHVLTHTLSGGVTVNDVAMHYLAEELPFGGVGESGMGAYHGEHGFRRFSHARSVLEQSRFDLAGLAGSRPPYGKRLARSLAWLIRR
ncbi:MAG TPA: coniferyl aldehyde dehydrogenase [Steroidobacteraceae bacterium]|jgi:coniferyl-aldehyde dehydrogenase|nr:coniferyl aldehyde dehydrogenase [Steroidobacteraceae bacterium]